MTAAHAHLKKITAAARAARVGESVALVLVGLKRLSDQGAAEGAAEAGGGGAAVAPATLDAVARLAAQLCPGLTSLLAAMQWGVHQSLQHHAESTRLELVLLNLFQSLFSEGFCTKPDADPDGDKGGEGGEGGQLDDDIEGTGMGQVVP